MKSSRGKIWKYIQLHSRRKMEAIFTVHGSLSGSLHQQTPIAPKGNTGLGSLRASHSNIFTNQSIKSLFCGRFCLKTSSLVNTVHSVTLTHGQQHNNSSLRAHPAPTSPSAPHASHSGPTAGSTSSPDTARHVSAQELKQEGQAASRFTQHVLGDSNILPLCTHP